MRCRASAPNVNAGMPSAGEPNPSLMYRSKAGTHPNTPSMIFVTRTSLAACPFSQLASSSSTVSEPDSGAPLAESKFLAARAPRADCQSSSLPGQTNLLTVSEASLAAPASESASLFSFLSIGTMVARGGTVASVPQPPYAAPSDVEPCTCQAHCSGRPLPTNRYVGAPRSPSCLLPLAERGGLPGTRPHCWFGDPEDHPNYSQELLNTADSRCTGIRRPITLSLT